MKYCVYSGALAADNYLVISGIPSASVSVKTPRVVPGFISHRLCVL